jgi:superfamily II DNA helicase RecQ
MLTSPHLIDVRERIQLNGKIISKERFSELSDKIRKNLATPNQLSYFEFLTLIAYQYYFEEKVDYENCSGCDICLLPKEEFDATLIAQKIISAMDEVSADSEHKDV